MRFLISLSRVLRPAFSLNTLSTEQLHREIFSEGARKYNMLGSEYDS